MADEDDNSQAEPATSPTNSGGKLERVSSHPLLEDPDLLASFIQSAATLAAARSNTDSLQDASDSSDDEGSERAASSILSSLQTTRLPAMPDEQDRKRFIGCLAALLGQEIFAYDCADNDDSEETQPSQRKPQHFPDRRASSSFELSFEDDGGEKTPSSDKSHHSASVKLEDEKEDTNYESGMLSCSSITESFEFSVSALTAAGFIEAPPTKTETTTQKARKTKGMNWILAVQRYRTRRYEIASQLLMLSADCLLIDRSQARAFLPMLSELLGSPSSPKSRTKTSNDVISQLTDEINFLQPFMESMTPGSGFRCLALFLIQHLFQADESGYDARVRYALKKLGVLLLIQDMERDPVDVLYKKRDQMNREQVLELATRKFEALEHYIARKLLLSQQKQNSQQSRWLPSSNANPKSHPHHPKNANFTNTSVSAAAASTDSSAVAAAARERLLRRVKIGGTAVVAGTLFAVTGGLAAPAIAAGVATIAGGIGIAGVLTSTAAVTAIFGVGGGSLAAYKMKRRTQGLTEFVFIKESSRPPKQQQQKKNKWGTGNRQEKTPAVDADLELHSTICLSGWLRDRHDFQRPWGVQPRTMKDRLELLERFYAVYRPDHVAKSAQILEHWKGEETQLWNLLEEIYGRNPSTLYPFTKGPRYTAALTLEQEEVVERLLVDLGYEEEVDTDGEGLPTGAFPLMPFEFFRRNWKKQRQSVPVEEEFASTATTALSSGLESVSLEDGEEESTAVAVQHPLPKHLATVWDYHAQYGGELYTIQWESHLLMKLCDSLAEMAFDLVGGTTAQILKHTALATLLSAVALPYALVNAANLIDGTWTLAVERSDEAGKELARSLLFTTAGRRPVTLVGYSFGGRAVYSCLKELARYQELWETQREQGGGKISREPASIVEDAVIMGLPNHLSPSAWKACRQVVAGRLINCYSQKDLILSLMFQLKRFGGLKPVCGVCAVNVPGVENFDVTDLVSGHQDYCLNAGEILKRVRHGQPYPPSTGQTQIKLLCDDVSKLDV